MSKVKKIVAGVVVIALVGTAAGGGLIYVRKGNQKEVLVASVSSLVSDYYGTDTSLSGNVYANATQRINVDKDMIIQEIYVSKGDEVKPGDKLISFDMTLVEMELNIAKLKLEKQQLDLATAKKRLTSLQNGGPILDSDTSSADNLIDSGSDSEGTVGSDDEENMDLSSALTGSDNYLAAVMQPLLLTAVDGFADVEEDDFLEDGTEDGASADTGSASDYYDQPSDDGGFNSGDSDSGQDGFISDGSKPLSPEPAPTPSLAPGMEFVNPDDQNGDPDFIDGEEPFYQTLDFDTEPYQGSGTKDDPFLYLCSSAKGKVNVTGSFLNKMAGYNADGTVLLQPGGYWYLLEFHQNDTIADYTNRKKSCTGYYLVQGSLLTKPVDRFAQMDFTLDGAMHYENDNEDPDIPIDNGGGDGSSSLSRSEAIKIQKNRIASLELDVQESEIKISKLEKKASRQLITSKLDGIVTTVGDAATGTNSESDSFLAVKSKDGYYVQGTVSELMLDQVKEGTILKCNSYGEYGYTVFDAEVVQVSDYAVEGDSSYYYGDGNPNVSSYTFTAKITDDTAQVSAGDWVDIQMESDQQTDTDGIVLSKAFVRTEDGVSYVYKEQNGVLKKQTVKVKENVNGGMYVLISAGISLDDKIAFPYAKSAQEGVKTKEGSLDDFMGYNSTSYSGGLG